MKKFLLVFIFLLSQCGYQSIYLNKNLNNLEFYKITHEGDAEINRKILGSLSFKENNLKDSLIVHFKLWKPQEIRKAK